MSTTHDNSATAERLGEPEWLSAWRAKEEASASVLPSGEQYGIGIPALEYEGVPSFDSVAEYHVKASKGLELYTWKEALAQEEIVAILERLLPSALLPNAASSLAARARAFFRSGLVVYVQPTLNEKGKALEETLTLETTIPPGESADVVVVIAKTGACLDMKSVLYGGDTLGVFARTLIVLTEEGAQVKVFSSDREAHGSISLESLLFVGAYSQCDFTEDPISETKYRSRVHGLLLGEGAKCEILHTLLATDQSSFDIWAGVEHIASHTTSRVFAVGIAADSSHIVYRGKIDMKKGISDVDGEQEGKFLILSRDASVDAIPALDIASKEVHSSHKLSVSHIRPLDLFYAKTRGISDTDARALALEGFFGILLGKIDKEVLLEEVRQRIARIATVQS